jgi:hypothetical protein
MTWMISKAIIAGILLTAFFTSAIVWYAKSSMSTNPRARLRLYVVESLMVLGIAVLYLRSANGRDSKLALMVAALVIASWLFRGARHLLRKNCNDRTGDKIA